MTISEYSTVTKYRTEHPDIPFPLILICFCVVDDEGNRVFRTSELTIGGMAEWDAGFVMTLGNAIVEHLGI